MQATSAKAKSGSLSPSKNKQTNKKQKKFLNQKTKNKNKTNKQQQNPQTLGLRPSSNFEKPPDEKLFCFFLMHSLMFIQTYYKTALVMRALGLVCVIDLKSYKIK